MTNTHLQVYGFYILSISRNKTCLQIKVNELLRYDVGVNKLESNSRTTLHLDTHFSKKNSVFIAVIHSTVTV
jgi:hypothetical protein